MRIKSIFESLPQATVKCSSQLELVCLIKFYSYCSQCVRCGARMLKFLLLLFTRASPSPIRNQFTSAVLYALEIPKRRKTCGQKAINHRSNQTRQGCASNGLHWIDLLTAKATAHDVLTQFTNSISHLRNAKRNRSPYFKFNGPSFEAGSTHTCTSETCLGLLHA